MSEEQLEALKQWVEAAIEYAFESRVEHADGQRGSCVEERQVALEAWERVLAKATDQRAENVR